ALRNVRYAARDAAAGALALFQATDYMQRGEVRIEHMQRPELEAVVIAMNVEALLWLAERSDVVPPIERWERAGLPGVALGRELFASGELRMLAEKGASAADAVEFVAARVCAEEPPYVVQHGPTVLVITGPPASGKSTLGRRLANELRLPYLSKDLFKETLFDALGSSNRDWSRELGRASMALLYRAVAALLEAGQSVALESNFYAQWDTAPLRDLQQRFGCRLVQIVCTAEPETLVPRYELRARSGTR